MRPEYQTAFAPLPGAPVPLPQYGLEVLNPYAYCGLAHFCRMIALAKMTAQPHKSELYHAGASERRRNSRFPVQERIQYKVLHSKATEHSGSGTTLNISSRGILFTTEQRLPAGRLVELSVNWPAKLGGSCPLKFVAVGRVIRAGDEMAAVRIQKYEFRTRSSAS